MFKYSVGYLYDRKLWHSTPSLAEGPQTSYQLGAGTLVLVEFQLKAIFEFEFELHQFILQL